MSGLFADDGIRPELDLSSRIEALKSALVFGDAAQAVGLQGSSEHGWNCPTCLSGLSLKERRDHKGARCSVCGTGFDALKVVMTVERLGFPAAVTFLEDLASSEAETPDLFGGDHDECD
ncbi:MAG: hypothetical protein QNI84_08070 [Henriciella sp.]|nr:hypothetical protein [Henriciella sp.]